MAEANVVPLTKHALIPNARDPNPDVVKLLEELLDQARSGELAGFAIALLHPGDLTSWNWAGRKTRSLLGAIELCKTQLCVAQLEES